MHPEQVTDKKTQKKIDDNYGSYADKKQFYIDTLAQGIATIAAAFYPKPVIVRFSDFKTNEYRNLIGGCYFEPEEENPMIGFRGAFAIIMIGIKKHLLLNVRRSKKCVSRWGLPMSKLWSHLCAHCKKAKE